MPPSCRDSAVPTTKEVPDVRPVRPRPVTEAPNAFYAGAPGCTLVFAPTVGRKLDQSAVSDRGTSGGQTQFSDTVSGLRPQPLDRKRLIPKTRERCPSR